MELIKAKEENITKQRILDIKRCAHLIDIGSEVECYNLTYKQVIKFFNLNSIIDIKSKLFIADNIYGNNTYAFVDAIQKNCNKIISYTMRFIKGKRLGTAESITLFYQLSYDMLLNYLETLILDSNSIANHGIEAFDCFQNNIILSNSGFVQVDCVDFKESDKDPKELSEYNIKLMCQTIYDCLIAPYMSTLLTNNHLSNEDFYRYPIDFIKELRRISQNNSDTEIITLNDTKKLTKRK